MPAKTGAERSKALRDKERAAGIKRRVLKLTTTEEGWIAEGQAIEGFTDQTEFLLHATRFYIEQRSKESAIVARDEDAKVNATV